jgi:hypothetical protein
MGIDTSGQDNQQQHPDKRLCVVHTELTYL